MDEIIKKIPRPVLVAVILAIGVAVALLSSPPGSICDVEISRMKGRLLGVVYSGKTKSGKKSAIYPRAIPACREGNSPGACLEFFSTLRKTMDSVSELSEVCQPQALADEDFQAKLKSGLILLVQLAWGEAPPDSGPTKAGWLEMSELSLFCKVKRGLQESMDEETWAGFQGGLISQLPGAQTLSDSDRFARSIFSINCDSFR